MPGARNRQGGHPGSGEPNPKKIWSKPVFWLIGVVVSAIGIAITNAIVPWLSEIIDVIPESGEPVLVSDVQTYWVPEKGYTVVFPKDIPLTDAMLSHVNGIEGIEEQTDWLIENGAAPVERLFIRIAVTGNREDGVRIVDAKPIAECSGPHTGTLFWAPPQGEEESIRLQFDLDQINPEPTYENELGEVVSYFPDKTISLNKNEQQVLQIEAMTTKHACSFTLEITVLEGNQRKNQRIYDSEGRAFRVSAWAGGSPGESQYDEVYLWRGFCGVERIWARTPESPVALIDINDCP